MFDSLVVGKEMYPRVDEERSYSQSEIILMLYELNAKIDAKNDKVIRP